MSAEKANANPDYVGNAARQERISKGPAPVERVWDYTCGNPSCPKPKAKDDGSPIRHKTKPAGQVPAKNCDGCGDWNWQKITGERTRVKK